MGRKNGDAQLKKRIREGQISREDVVRRLAELAFGRANDCVKLDWMRTLHWTCWI